MKKMYEGKAKILFDDGVEGTLIQKFKDSATAFNAKKKNEFDGKGLLNRRISEIMFGYLEKKGIKLTKKYTMESPLAEMKGEYEMIKADKEKQNSVVK